MASVTTSLSPAQRDVLTELKRRGEATADEVSETLGTSASAVRQHLATLRSAGLIASRRRRGQPGRPVEAHHATAAAESLFATQDSDLSLEILELVEAEDPSLISRIFERRRARLVADAGSQLHGRSAEERVEIVVSLLLDQGYLADGERVGPCHHRINLRSCAIWGLASHFGQACTSELDLIRELIPDATIERTSTKTNGAHTCSYDIQIGKTP